MCNISLKNIINEEISLTRPAECRVSHFFKFFHNVAPFSHKLNIEQHTAAKDIWLANALVGLSWSKRASYIAKNT